MKCSLGISNFPEELSSLSHSIVFLYFFVLITEEGFFISPFYSLELCIQMGISFLFSFAFNFFSQLFVRPPQTTILPFCIFFLGTSESRQNPSEGRQNENHNHRKLTKLITWTTALSDSMKPWAMPCRATQDGWVMLESSNKKCGPLEKGMNGKPLQFSCLEKPNEQYEKVKR